MISLHRVIYYLLYTNLNRSIHYYYIMMMIEIERPEIEIDFKWLELKEKFMVDGYELIGINNIPGLYTVRIINK